VTGASDQDPGDPVVLDVRGLLCPLPVLKARKAIGRIAVGERLLVLATDPMAKIDVPHFCNENGHRLITSDAAEEVFSFLIERGP
jgi:tRNA 2-thiouridine synthesizing protein A